MTEMPKGYTKRKSGDVKRIGSPRSKPILCITTGRRYRDAKICHSDMVKDHPNLKYADIVQRCRGGSWHALLARLGDLDFRWLKEDENPFVSTWVETPTKLNDISKEDMTKGNRKLLDNINRGKIK